MIKIRQLTERDMTEAINLKCMCFPEELAGFSDKEMDYKKELTFWISWMKTGLENNDIRLLIGAFEDEEMLGVLFGSFAESYDISHNGIELNGLWVFPDKRGKGAALRLLHYLVNFYSKHGKDKMVVYNYHHSPSNSFYRKLGMEILRTEEQEGIPVDVFICDMVTLNKTLDKLLKKY